MQQNDCRDVGSVTTIVTHCQADTVTPVVTVRSMQPSPTVGVDAAGRNAAGARPELRAADMADSSVGVDVGKRSRHPDALEVTERRRRWLACAHKPRKQRY